MEKEPQKRHAAVVFELNITAGSSELVDKEEDVSSTLAFEIHRAQHSWVPSTGAFAGRLAPVSSSTPFIASEISQGRLLETLDFSWDFIRSDYRSSIGKKPVPSDQLAASFDPDHPVLIAPKSSLKFKVWPMNPTVSGKLYIVLHGHEFEVD